LGPELRGLAAERVKYTLRVFTEQTLRSRTALSCRPGTPDGAALRRAVSVVETSQVLNENLSVTTGTAGRLLGGHAPRRALHPEPRTGIRLFFLLCLFKRPGHGKGPALRGDVPRSPWPPTGSRSGPGTSLRGAVPAVADRGRCCCPLAGVYRRACDRRV